MKFKILGNYYNGSFQNKDLEKNPDKVMGKFSPCDLDLHLWDVPVKYNEVDNILSSAVEGFQKWRKTTIEERIQVLSRFKESVSLRKNEIAEAISLEMGKPYWEAIIEVTAIMNKVDVTINDSLPRIKERHIENILPNTDGHVYYKPIGPCLIIGPFNFPCHLANGQITACLISGNSIIFKPSEKTCYSGQLLVECLHQAGFPNGVINLAQGDGELARRILKEKAIKGVYFTGSVEVGRKILSVTHLDLSKLVALELGGKNSSIVHKDANLELATKELIKACFLTSGQRCISTSIVPIHRSIMEQFIENFHQIAKTIIIDHPIEHEIEPFMGPLVDQQSLDNYLLFMGMAKREGIDEIMRGKQLQRKFRGYYVSPSIHFSKSFNKSSHFLMNEIFGPNCTFIPFDEIEEAIQIANGTDFGLAASVFSSDSEIYKKCLNEIDAGQVNFNRSTVGASSKLPFGGVKNSGNYRPAALTNIDGTVYQMASLELKNFEGAIKEEIKGIKF